MPNKKPTRTQRQTVTESRNLPLDVINFSAYAGMYSDGAHAIFTGRDGTGRVLAADGNRPRKYYIDGVETAWEDVKRIVGNQKIQPIQGMQDNFRESNRNVTGPNMDETVGDGASDADRNPSIERDKYRNRHPGPSAADREKAQIGRDRAAGMQMDPMDIRKRERERAMWGESVAVTTGDTDAWTNGHVAGKKGKGTNPHEKGSKDAKEWARGFAHATSGTPATRKRTVKESVLDDVDDDGFMAKRQLYDIAKYAVALHRMIQDTDNLEPWVQAKITKAQDYIDTVKHYLEYGQFRDAEQSADMMGPPDMGDADIDTVGMEVDTLGPRESIVEYGDEDEGTELTGVDILRMARDRGIISREQYDFPDANLEQAADSFAYDIGPVWEIGSSDVSIWMKQFIEMYGANIILDGPRGHLYESKIQAKRIYSNMIRGLKGNSK